MKVDYLETGHSFHENLSLSQVIILYTSFRKTTSMLYVYIMIRIFPTCFCPATCFSQIIFVNFHCPSYVQFRSIFVFPCKTGHYSGNQAVSTRDTPIPYFQFRYRFWCYILGINRYRCNTARID